MFTTEYKFVLIISKHEQNVNGIFIKSTTEFQRIK
jgi:hypothetical protein